MLISFEAENTSRGGYSYSFRNFSVLKKRIKKICFLFESTKNGESEL